MIWKLLLLLFAVLVVFGPGKLPGAMKDIGKGLKSFKDEFSKDDKEDSADKAILVNPDDKKDS